MLYTINHQTTNETLYSGEFKNFKHAVEHAIRDNVCLDFADFSGRNMNMVNLDGGSFRYARFHKTQLHNANLSEANFEGAQFNHCILDNSFLCESILDHAGFIDNGMTGCDIAATSLRHTILSGYSSLALNFRDCDIIEDCIYYDQNKKACHFSHAPIVIYGLSKRLVCIGQNIDVNGVLQDIRPITNIHMTHDMKHVITTLNRLMIADI